MKFTETKPLPVHPHEIGKAEPEPTPTELATNRGRAILIAGDAVGSPYTIAAEDAHLEPGGRFWVVPFSRDVEQQPEHEGSAFDNDDLLTPMFMD